MKVGAEHRSKLIIASVLMMLALIIAGRSIFEWQSPAQVVAASGAIHGTPITDIQRKKGKPNSIDIYFSRMQFSENHEYAGNGRNIFALNSESDIKKTTAVDPNSTPQGLTQHPSPQVISIPLKFFGFATIKGAPRKVCVHDEDSVFIAREGEIVRSRYKILNVTSTSVEVEDLIENSGQTLMLQHD
jgi:hypothetical protein